MSRCSGCEASLRSCRFACIASAFTGFALLAAVLGPSPGADEDDSCLPKCLGRVLGLVVVVVVVLLVSDGALFGLEVDAPAVWPPTCTKELAFTSGGGSQAEMLEQRT